MQPKSPEEPERILADTVDRLRRAFSPIAIYLFGSYAYGTPSRGSDLDLLVVVENSPLSVSERDGLAYQSLGRHTLPIDVMVYTREEFESRAALPVSFERTVKLKARVLYAA